MREEDKPKVSSNIQKLFDDRAEHTLEEQLAILAEITQSFASSLDISDTFQRAIEAFIEYMNAEAASIFLLEEEGTVLVCRECAGPVNIKGLRVKSDDGIVGKAAQTRSCCMVRDVYADPDFDETVDKVTGFITRSILCAPLMVKGECLGVLEVINKQGDDVLFGEQDKHLSMALASAAALAIHNAKMADKLVGQERMRKELELAREIQLSLLPSSEDNDLPVKGMNVPAMEVSGDFYDFFRRDDGKIYFNLADVSGKGMNAALLMAKASSLLHHLAKSIDDPGELLARVNDELCETVSHGMFITIVSGFIDLNKGEIALSNAGHQPPLYHKSNGVFEEIPAQAYPLGILPCTEFPVTTLSMEEGCLYMFTDGVTESLDENNQPLDIPGLIKLIESSSRVTAAKRLENIVAEIRKPNVSQHDDITIMIIDCNPT